MCSLGRAGGEGQAPPARFLCLAPPLSRSGTSLHFPPVSSCPAPLPLQPLAPTAAFPAASQQSWVKEKKQNTNQPLLSQCRPGWRLLPDSHHPRQPLLQLLRALYHVHPGGIPPGRAPRRGAGAAGGQELGAVGRAGGFGGSGTQVSLAQRCRVFCPESSPLHPPPEQDDVKMTMTLRCPHGRPSSPAQPQRWDWDTRPHSCSVD